MAITSQKLLPGSTFSNTSSDTDNIKSPKKTDPGLNIYKKVVKIDKLLKDSFLLRSKEENRKKRELENQKREGKEKELESPKKFKGFEILKNALPRTGFFDSIKRFILFTFAGWLFTNLFKFLPKILEFIKIITPVLSWFEKGIGLLLEGIVSFIDLGYKAYDTVRSFAKTIGGEGLLEKFDALSGALNTFLNLALIAGMSAASLGGGFGGKGKGGPGIGARPKPGTGGRPRVTTSGGAGIGRPDIRNPFRQRPTVTGGSGSGIRNPLRQRPTVTTSGGKAVGKGLGKGLGKIGSKIPFVGPLIDFGIRRLIFREPLGKAAAGAVGAGAGQALGGWLGGSLGGIVGSVVPVAGTLLGAGAGSLIGSVAGGFIGDWIGTSLYDFIEANDDIKTKKMSSGGKVSSSSTIKGKKGNKSKLKKQSLGKIQLGKDIGGEKEIEKIYPNPDRKLFGIFSFGEEFNWNNLLFGGGKNKKSKKKDRKKIPNAIKTLLGVADALGKSGDWISILMRAPIEIALGKKPDIKYISRAISGVLQSVSDPAIKGVKSLTKELFGFAGGGEIPELSDSLISSSETLKLERSIEQNLRTKFDDALKVVSTESKKKGVGREEMIEENIQRGSGAAEGDEPGGRGGGGIIMGTSFDQSLAKLLKSYEGLRTTAYPDPTHGWSIPTIGMGATYYPKGFRLSGKVKRGDTITEDEALWIKMQHIKEHRQRLLRDISATEYAKVPDNVKAALESKTFNYGSLGSTIAGLVKEGIKTGNYKSVADYFRNTLAKHNGGINSWRRNDEAGVIETGVSNRAKVSFPKSSGGKALSEYKEKGGKTIEQYEGEDPRGKGKGKDEKYSPSGSNVVSIGKSLIGQGFAVGEHPDFTKTTPKGSYTPGKGYVSNVHKGKGHYAGRAIDVTDWRGSLEDSKARYRSVLDSLWANRQKNNINMLIHDSWGYAGSWGKDPPGKHGHPTHMHIETKQGGGLLAPSKPSMPIPDSFASYNDPRKSSTLAIRPVIIEKDNPIPVNSPMYFPSSGSSGVNNSMLPSLMQG
jgi:GH24 family phage-related lysozyme (muramidase)